jgi:hypothetical protein
VKKSGIFLTSRTVFCIVIGEIVKPLIATDYLELGLSALFSQAAQACDFFFPGGIRHV